MKNKYLLISILILILLIIIYVLYNINVLNNYTSSFFEVDFNKEWNQIASNKQSLILQNENGSIIQMIGKKLTISNEKPIEDTYFDVEEEFQKENKDYSLINIYSTKVGKKYQEAAEYLYEYNDYQTLLIIILKKDAVIEITYTAHNQYFDFDLIEFYQVLNTLQINGETI